MDVGTREWLACHRWDFPTLAGPKATGENLLALEEAVGCHVPTELREFLSELGSMMVGSLPIFGVEPAEVMGVDDTIDAETLRFRREPAWRLPPDALVISNDGRGNPVVLTADGRVFLHDHDAIGGLSVEPLATSFGEYVIRLVRDIHARRRDGHGS